MSGGQGDFFSGGGFPASQDAPPGAKHPTVAWHALAEEELISALSDADMAGSLAVIGEIGRRKLVEAIPALEQLCQRFRGFGLDRIVPEQATAFDALVMIGGREAAQAVARQIVGGVVQGPGLKKAVRAAADLGAAALDALDAIGHPFAARMVAALRAAR